MSEHSPLEKLGEPLLFEASKTGLEPPRVRHEQAQRTLVRTLEGMQKEALVSSSHSETTWRLASDEGDYLDGDDVAPCPLAFFLTGMVCSYTNRIQELADQRDLEIRDFELVLDSFYTMKGSALRGDMTGGALPPELDVTLDVDASEEAVEELIDDAIATAPISGLLGEELDSLFALTLNETQVDTNSVAEFDSDLTDPAPVFENLSSDVGPRDDTVITHTGNRTEEYPGDQDNYTAGDGSSLQEEQDRVLHLRGTCTLRDDGVKRVEQKLYSPKGSIFEFLSDEPEGHGGQGKAPDAMTYAVAGIGFCFMTQFGRYADITGKELSTYRIVQDTHFAGGTSGEDDSATADPIETHVFLESPEGESFAREILDMSEQTCFLHALCRTDLEPVVEVSTK